MAEERLSYTDTLARLDERLKSVERRLDQPMNCVEGAVVRQRLDIVVETLKDLAAIREDDHRTLSTHERRIQSLEDRKADAKALVEQEKRMRSLEERAHVQVAKIAALAALVGTVVTGAIQLIMTLA